MQFTTTKAKEIAKQAAENPNVDIKSGACLVSVTVSGSCGERSIPKATIEFEGVKLDSTLVKGTTVQWFPSNKLSFVNRSNQAVDRLMNNYGVSHSKKLTLVPLSRLDEFTADLEKINQKFEEALEGACTDYDIIVEEHMQNNPELAQLIDRLKLDVTEFRGKFTFKVDPPMAVSPLFDEDVEEITQNASDKLWDEVAETASKLHSGSFFGQEKTSKKAVTAVRKIRSKLLGLSFLHAGMDQVIEAFDQTLNSLPDGPISGGDFHRVGHFLSQISSPASLKLLAEGVPLAQPEFEFEDEEPTIENLDQAFVSTDSFIDDNYKPFKQEPVALELDFGMF